MKFHYFIHYILLIDHIGIWSCELMERGPTCNIFKNKILPCYMSVLKTFLCYL